MKDFCTGMISAHSDSKLLINHHKHIICNEAKYQIVKYQPQS